MILIFLLILFAFILVYNTNNSILISLDSIMSDPKPADDVEQETVDDSKLKLPEVHLEKVDIKVDEGEDCLYTQYDLYYIFTDDVVFFYFLKKKNMVVK